MPRPRRHPPQDRRRQACDDIVAERLKDLWLTRDGRRIELADLSDAHLANAIAVLGPWYRQERDFVQRGHLKWWLMRLKQERTTRAKRARRQQRHRGSNSAVPDKAEPP